MTEKKTQWILNPSLLLLQVGPVNPTGAEERTYQHHAPKNVYMPRKMYPVENYAQAKHGET